MTAVFLLISSALIRVIWPRIKPDIHWICPVLSFALPFAAGGFHTATAAVLSLFLTCALLEQIHQNGTLCFWWNKHSVSILLLFAAYCVTPLWAADKGMSVFALTRYLPPVLYMLLAMQLKDDIGEQILHLIPWCGCLMVIAASSALLFPVLSGHVTIYGRLAGFFQYPNSFAAFLLVGLMVQSFHMTRKTDILLTLILVVGIVLSGSKTVFVLMTLFMVAIVLLKRRLVPALILGAILVLSLLAGFLSDSLGILYNADRFTDIHASSGTFLVRLLYYRDVLPSILSHPFGIGYMGYPAIEGTIQTGRYYVSFIHNGFLQLLLEIGWIPSFLLFLSLISTAFSPRTPIKSKLALLAVLSHCMLDFDLQFGVFWIILLSCVNYSVGKQTLIRSCKLAASVLALLTAAVLWLGSGDWLYRMEKPELCLKVVPFHTDALTYQMSVNPDPQQADQLADRILRLNATHSLAFSAKANAAYARGDIQSMILYKENAIAHARYTTAEYCDYFQKLYTAMQVYLKSGDTGSATYCREKLLKIPQMMEAVSQSTHILANMTGDDSSLSLPQEYSALLRQLQ